MYSMTLGIVGHSGISKQAPINETCQHLGNSSFAIMAFLIVLFTPRDITIFYVIVFMRCLSCAAVFLINDADIDYFKARGLVKGSSSEIISEPVSFRHLFSDFNLLLYIYTVLFFHFSNAAMLPLLSQKMFIDNSERGFEFAALAVIIAVSA